MLRALANRQSHASNIGRAIELLRKNYRNSLDVNELAKSVGMSPSSFHRHFKSMTMTTPLQYQKDLRLTEARRLLRTGETSVSSAALEVGYESPSQFSREYSRKFGSPPRVDLQVA
jgi:transcriptional regulator GlxA family with amidase domain